MPQLPQVPRGARENALMSIQWLMFWSLGTGSPTQFGRSLPRCPCRAGELPSMIVMGQPECVCSGAHVDGSPTPGSGWLPSTGVTRCVALCPTYPIFADVDGVRRYSAKTFHCWVNCGRRFGSQARTWPDG